MAQENTTANRANIRIEIKNDFNEKMEVDKPISDEKDSSNNSEGEIEEGEIDDDTQMHTNNKETCAEVASNRKTGPNRIENQWTNIDGGFTTGVDIFGKDVQEKLQTRAQRFGLDPSECTAMTDAQLQELHDSLGITVEDEIDTRFEAIHMYGTEEMSTQDIFGYFGKYGPAFIEWINDVSCNVVWHDRVSAARAFHGLSKPIRGMPVSGLCNPFKEENKNQNRSILLIPKEDLEPDENMFNDNKDIIHVSKINMAIPPGFWRLGVSHSKSKDILLRFAKRSDKKPSRAEKFSEYYKKHGNPNYGGLRGLISESRKRKMRSPEESDADTKNPWGQLAKNWNNDVHETIEHVPQPLKLPANKLSKSMLDRIGVGTKPTESDESSGEETKKSKIPRMKMYADEEEARIKKIKETKKLLALEKIEEILTSEIRSNDLRNRIGRQSQTIVDNVPHSRQDSETETEYSSDSDNSEEDVNVKQRSKVTVIVRKPHKPTVASTVWSRLDKEQLENNAKTNSDESSSSSESEDESKYRIKSRPGFGKPNLKSRLGVKEERKSPLRIEINNDHYKS